MLTPHGWYIKQVKKGWHRWFAWYPVIGENVEEYLWFEWVERKITGLNDYTLTSSATYKYRKI